MKHETGETARVAQTTACGPFSTIPFVEKRSATALAIQACQQDVCHKKFQKYQEVLCVIIGGVPWVLTGQCHLRVKKPASEGLASQPNLNCNWKFMHATA